MVGHIRTKEKCPVCRKKYGHIPRLGFICETHQTIPRSFYFDFQYEKQRIEIHRNRAGKKIRSYQEAFDIQHQINKEMEEGRFDLSNYSRAGLSKFFVCNLLERFFATRDYAPSCLKDYRLYKKRAADFWNETDVREIKRLHLINYKDALSKGIQGKTLKNNLDFFKTFILWCRAELGIIPELPSFPKIECHQKPISWVAQSDQVDLFGHVPERDKPIIAFLMLSGCRPGEARALKIKDVNLENQSVHVVGTFSGRTYREKRKGKESKSVVLPVHPELLGYITARCRSALPGAWLFHRKEVNYSENALRRIWASVKAKAGISGLRLYDATRHSFASQLINAGADIIQVSRLLGHTDIRTTQKYAHSSLEGLRVQVEKLSLNKIAPFCAEPKEKAQEVK